MNGAAIAGSLGHEFRDPGLLRQALTHRSHSQPHNERLEFVGDAVLDCVVAVVLHDRFPGASEGELSRMRASLVNQSALAARAAEIGLAQHLLLGEGEAKAGGGGRPSILADALEALIGAIFIDGGFAAARATVLNLFGPSFEGLEVSNSGKDPKTALQEWLQARRQALPEYRIVRVSGEAHRQEFEVECTVEGGVRTLGTGGSRRGAEQMAARAALEILHAGEVR